MALIDLKTNLANLKNVDNIDNTYQDGFTPNRKTKSPTEFKNNTSQLGTGENVDLRVKIMDYKFLYFYLRFEIVDKIVLV